jgi:hypothetical protein
MLPNVPEEGSPKMIIQAIQCSVPASQETLMINGYISLVEKSPLIVDIM